MAQKQYKSLKQFFANPRRWRKAAANDGKGRYCLIGAADRVYSPERSGSVIRKLRAVIGQLYPGFVGYNGMVSIAGFNDAETTRLKDIRRVVKHAGV